MEWCEEAVKEHGWLLEADKVGKEMNFLPEPLRKLIQQLEFRFLTFRTVQKINRYCLSHEFCCNLLSSDRKWIQVFSSNLWYLSSEQLCLYYSVLWTTDALASGSQRCLLNKGISQNSLFYLFMKTVNAINQSNYRTRTFMLHCWGSLSFIVLCSVSYKASFANLYICGCFKWEAKSGPCFIFTKIKEVKLILITCLTHLSMPKILTF